MESMNFNDYEEYLDYEIRLKNHKNSYTDEELEEWRQWAEKWAKDE